jgi:hypothetical protein
VFIAQADWTFILPSELPTKELCYLPRKMPQQAYQTSEHAVPRESIFFSRQVVQHFSQEVPTVK